jgi:choline monooxygenase
LDGSLRGAPHSNQAETFNPEQACLKPVRVEEFCNFIFVNLDSEAPSLRELIPELESQVLKAIPKFYDLRHAHRVTYDMAANWKTIVDNYLECYHCPVAHPAFNNTFQIGSYKLTNFPFFSIQGKVRNPRARDPEELEYTEQCSWWIWPNIFWPRFPGTSMMVINNLPVGPEQTLQTIDIFLQDKNPTPQESADIDWIERVAGIEDKGLVEQVQLGLHSRGYHQGQLIMDSYQVAGWSEHGVRQFRDMVLDAMDNTEVTRRR